MHAPVSKVAEADVEEDVGIAVVVMMLNTGAEVVEVAEADENDGGNEVVLEEVGDCENTVARSDNVEFEKVGDCEEEVDDGLKSELVMEKIWRIGDGVGDARIVVGTVTAAIIAEEKTLAREGDSEEIVVVTRIVVALVTMSVRTNVDVDSVMVVETVVLRKSTEDAVVVTLV